MLRRLWLTFAQATTVGLALLFIVATLRPEWLREAPPNLPRAIAPALTVQPEAAGAPRAAALGSYADAARKAMPAVVSVYTTKEMRRQPFTGDPFFERFFGGGKSLSERVTGLGSGVIATNDGYVITNNHVVEAADEIQVALGDGRRLPAKLVGTDPESDLAVLRVEADNLPTITLGRTDAVRVGDVVLAIGNPFNVGQTVTMGIVSALGRSNLGINRYENFVQTDAAINQGNSGGALVDTAGNLVGINTAIFSRDGGSIGIGFAIPTVLVTDVMQQLVKTGKVVRGYFGIEPEDITQEMARTLKLARNDGVLVRGVLRTAPAGRAGMEPLDIILAINDSEVRDTATMLNQIAALPPGTVAKVNVLRDGKPTQLAVTVGERPAPRDQR
jgi:serine protease DegQ